MRCGNAHFAQVGVDGSIHRGVLGALQHAGVVQRVVASGLPGQADVGAADVGEKTLRRMHRRKMGQRPLAASTPQRGRQMRTDGSRWGVKAIIYIAINA
ncbi:hypothetical protein D3C71_1774010 [compost metagenome]